MTKQELLYPRYMVIGQWPGSKEQNFSVGKIITLNEITNHGKHWHKYTDAEPIHIEEGWNEFPLLFRLMHWWEQREEKDMPGYLSIKLTYDTSPSFYKIERWDMKLWVGWVKGKTAFCSLTSWRPDFCYLPATEEEYNEYIKTKK